MHFPRHHRPAARLRLFLVLAILAAAFGCPQVSWAAKNVILMVSDGAGYNTWLAASMYQGKVGRQIYDQPGWLRLPCSTYSLNRSSKPTGDAKQDPALVYDPLKAWDAAMQATKTGSVAGYAFLT